MEGLLMPSKLQFDLSKMDRFFTPITARLRCLPPSPA
jgi:hypothetical protein